MLIDDFLQIFFLGQAYDLFDDGQEWLKRGEFRKLATRGYWKMRMRQIPELVKKIRQAPQAIRLLWTYVNQVPAFLLMLGKKIADLIKRKRNGTPPKP